MDIYSQFERRGEFGRRRGEFVGKFPRRATADSPHQLSRVTTCPWSLSGRPSPVRPLRIFEMSGFGLQPLTGAAIKDEKGPRWQATRSADGSLCATALPAANWRSQTPKLIILKASHLDLTRHAGY